MYPSSSVSPVRILIIDDDEDDFALTRDLILGIRGGEFHIDWCKTYNEGNTALVNSAYNIYFIDYYLGAKTGIDLLREAIQLDCKDPIILLTGQGNTKVDVEAMRSGAADYLVKSELTSEKLERCIRYALERAANLEQSRSNERKFRKIFDRSKDVIFISNQDLRLYDVNTAATELFGYEIEELLQVSLFDLMSDTAEKDELAEMLTANKEIIDFGISFQTSKKSIKNCILSVSMEIDATIGNAYVQGMIRDISLAKKIDEIKRQSKKLEEKGLVIRTLAHEIRNPLHNITLSLGLLKASASDINREFLNVIERNSKRINDLINELMDSNQYYKMKLKVIPLQTVLKETLEKAADRITLSKIKINFNYPDEDAKVLVDKEKLKIAFLNVIINAIEATAKEDGEILISIISGANIHKVIIQDNGCGMSGEATKNLFEPYFTLKPKGMGLGLASTFAIMQSHKAEIEVSSVLQKGTSFQFSFQAF